MSTDHSVCRICSARQTQQFSRTILGKYDVVYFQCVRCGFLQTQEPFWLAEAYSSVIATSDVGYVSRNITLSNRVASLIWQHFDPHGRFLDYAGGYGLFVRLMRDKGLDFYWQDPYCQNLFAQYFEFHALQPTQQSFELITGLEALEHLFDPYQTLDEIFNYTDSFLFSTLLQPPQDALKDWWYLSTGTGQHISFYTMASLQAIAQHYQCQFYSNQQNLHLLTRKKMTSVPFQRPSRLSKWLLFGRKKRKPVVLRSLMQQDHQYVKSIVLHSIKASS